MEDKYVGVSVWEGKVRGNSSLELMHVNTGGKGASGSSKTARLTYSSCTANIPHSKLILSKISFVKISLPPNSKTAVSPPPDLFLGPVCEYALAPVARYASAWRLPVVTAGGRADAFRHKAPSYSTLTRIAGPYSGVGNAMRVILAERFGWKRAALLYHNNAREAVSSSTAAPGNSRCHFALGAVYEAMGRVGPHQSFDEARVKREELRALLLSVSLSARSKCPTVCATAMFALCDCTVDLHESAAPIVLEKLV
ncbi:hypothetical protein J437_LFUL009437 [Ladona fulva]|uniref:Receptor ligand binding region domain-containing protein n=1 Tax=Ladona fulva TaxID=123851 RepID=A0A8K0JZE6_LADFU|nr:hypothetical protein J437_LFUL009437 [Ladona fulva]